MNRDWWQIRHVLLEIRAGKTLPLKSPVMRHHIHLCQQAGFLKGQVAWTGPTVDPKDEVHFWGGGPPSLTWEGQEAAALLENPDLLTAALADLEPYGTPWDVLRPLLIQRSLTHAMPSHDPGPTWFQPRSG